MLKPRPFRGCEEIVVQRHDYNFFRAVCTNCPASVSHLETREGAVTAWNERDQEKKDTLAG